MPLHAFFTPRSIALVGATERVDSVGLSHPLLIEADINPLLATAQGIIALDARIVLR